MEKLFLQNPLTLARKRGSIVLTFVVEVTMIKDEELLEKAERGEGLTVEEVKRYQELVPPVHHVYGRYGTLARLYLEEH